MPACKECLRELPVEQFYLTRAGNPRGKCKECYGRDQAWREAVRALTFPDEATLARRYRKATCSKCGKRKYRDEFSRGGSRKANGLSSWCRACVAARAKERNNAR